MSFFIEHIFHFFQKPFNIIHLQCRYCNGVVSNAEVLHSLSLSTLSHLLKTSNLAICDSFNSNNIFSTVFICSSNAGLLISTMCIKRSASCSSSSVERNESSKSDGRLLMNPTVSLMIASCSLGNLSLLLVGSSVAK